MVREADLAGPRLRAAADERRVRDRVVRRAERTLRDQADARAAAARPPSGRSSTRAPRRTSAAAGFPPSAAPSSSCRRRADRRAADCDRRPRQSRARGAPSSCPRTSARSACVDGAGSRRRGGHHGRVVVGSLTARDGLGQRRHRQECRSPARPPPRSRSPRQQHARTRPRAGGGRDRQHAARRLESAPSSDSSPSTSMSATDRRVDDALRGQDAERNRQVERCTGLAHVGRRQVHGDAVRRELEAGVPDRAAHAVAALAHAGVRQADHREDGHAERDVDLDVHRRRPRRRRAPPFAGVASMPRRSCKERPAESA